MRKYGIHQIRQDLKALIFQTGKGFLFPLPCSLDLITQFQASPVTQPIQFQASVESSQPSEISLHSFRKRKGLSQSQLALDLGVSRSRVANWESGRSQIPEDVLKKLS